jgi:hypothetical protein
VAVARDVRAGTRLAEVVDLRIEDVGADGRRVLELVAIGAPLEVGLLEPDELAALEALERSELPQRRAAGRRRFADVAHPLHGEAVRVQLARTRTDAIHTRLADAVEARGAGRGGDLLRVAVSADGSGPLRMLPGSSAAEIDVITNACPNRTPPLVETV